jgi:RimJ/RimL family protein N-acetyltransferase
MLSPRVRLERGIEFVTRVLNEQRRGRGYSFSILRNDSRVLIGQIRLLDWSPADGRAEVGYWIRRREWGRGFGSEALRLVCRFGFRTMRLHRIIATVVVGNRRSIRTLERVGFRREGRGRRAARLARGWADEWMYSMLPSELRANADR